MKSLRTLAALTACFISAAAFAADASGTWTFQTQGRGGNAPATNTLVLAQKDGKLTGKLTSPGRNGETTTDISNAKVEGDTISFSVERNFGGNSIVTKYSGKLEGDKIVGKMEAPGRDGGAATPRDWNATKSK
jgi:hypothetical protein